MIDLDTNPNRKDISTTTVIMELKDIVKNYDTFKLGPINLTINEGDIISLLGKNGSGKSSMIRVLTGSMDFNSGELLFLGKKFRCESFLLKRSMGYLPQDLYLPHWSSCSEILSYALKLYDIKDPTRMDSSMEYWDSVSYKNIPMGACSHGMQKRVALSLATISDPSFLVLDEPFSGLDLFHIKALTNCIEQRKINKKATLICTHLAPYAAKLCTRALIMKDGCLEEITEWKDLSFEKRISILENNIFK